MRFEFFADQSIDPFTFSANGLIEGIEGPVERPLCALLNPASKQVNIRVAKRLGMIMRWHHNVGVVGSDPRNQFARFRIAANDRLIAAEIGECTLFGIET